MITREQYLTTQSRIMELAAEVATLPLEEFIEALRQVEAVDPNLAVGGTLVAVSKRLAEGALIFKRCAPDGFRFVASAPSTLAAPPRRHAAPGPVSGGQREAESDDDARSDLQPPATRSTIKGEAGGRGQPAFDRAIHS